MANEYTTITVDMARLDSTAPTGTLYAELAHVVTLANNDVVYPEKRAFTVTSGAASISLACTTTAIKNQNAAYVISFAPTGGTERVLGRIIPTASVTPLNLSDLLEVGATALVVNRAVVGASDISTFASIAALQATTGRGTGDKALVHDVGWFRCAGNVGGAVGQLVVSDGDGKEWYLETESVRSLAKVFDIRLYGAATSLANNTTAINLAIDAAYAAGGGVAYVPTGTWPCTAQVVLKANVTLAGDGYGSHLDFSTAGAITTCIKAAGSLAETSVAFSATITKGATTITFPSAPSGVAAGTPLLIYDSFNGGFNTARNEYRAGEWCKVKSVSGGTVTLDGPVFDTYATGGTRKIYVVTPVTAQVRNLRATFKAGVTGIEFELGHKCLAVDLDLSGSDTSCLTLDRCFEVSVERVKAFDVSASIGLNYGLIISNSQRVIVDGCHLDTTRHGLAVGGSDVDGCVPNRDVLVSNNLINGHLDSLPGADIHGNCEFVAYRNNRLLAGISFGGDHITIAGNDIRTNSGTEKNGISASELLGPNIVIRDNTITATGALTSGNSAAINFSKNSSSWRYAARSGTLAIRGNSINMASYDGAGIYVRNGQANDMLATSTTMIDLDVSGNVVSGTAASTARTGVEIVGQPTGTADKGFRTVHVAGNTLNNATLSVNAPGARTTIITGNDSLSAAVQGIVYGAAANYHGTYQTEEELIIIEGNRVVRPNSTGIQVVGVDVNRSFVQIRGNHAVSACQGGTTGSNSTDSSLYVADATVALIEGNTFGKMPNDATGAQTRCIGLNTVTTVFERGNQNVGTVVTNEIASVTNRSLDTFFPFNFSGVPGAAAIYTHVVTRRCIIPATAPGSYAKAGTAATGTPVFDIAVGGVAKGTFAWAAAGTVATFTVAADVVLAPGDVLTITTENPADGTLANIGGALAAYAY